MPFRVLIFDVDGVLFNTDEVYFLYLQGALAHVGVSIDEKFYAEHHFDDCIHDLGLDDETKERVLKSLKSAYYSDAVLSHVRMKEGVPKALAVLSQSFRLAIGSGEREPQIIRYLNHFGLRNYFSFIGHEKLVEGRKSNPAYFRTIAAHFGVQPEQCLHVGDTPIDQQALAAGVPVVIIPTRYTARLSFDPRCVVLENITALPAYLKQNCPALPPA